MSARKLKGRGVVAPLENSPFGEEVARRVARAGTEILRTGPLTAKALVEYSRPKSSPTHRDVFHCSEEQAKESYWLDRATKLIGCVYVINSATKKAARMYYTVMSSTESGPRRSYRPLGEVVGNPNLLGQVSLDGYTSVASTCDRMEALGLEKDPAWRKIIACVRANVPAGAR